MIQWNFGTANFPIKELSFHTVEYGLNLANTDCLTFFVHLWYVIVTIPVTRIGIRHG